MHPDPWISEEELISISSYSVSSEDAFAKLQGTAEENSVIPECDELSEEQDSRTVQELWHLFSSAFLSASGQVEGHLCLGL